MKVVSNSSPLIGLARVNHLDFFHRLYEEIYVPAAVWNEVVVQGSSQPGAAAIGQAAWIRQGIVRNTPLVLSLTQELGAGEAQAIVLAQELSADMLIVDERLAREKARRLGIRFMGVCNYVSELLRNPVPFGNSERDVPERRLKVGAGGYPFSRPFGTRILSTTIPALKRRAIIGMSLRDKPSSNFQKELTQTQSFRLQADTTDHEPRLNHLLFQSLEFLL